MSNQSAAHAALDALGDPTRRRIIEALRDGPIPVGELAADLPVGRPAVSKHLRVLEGAGLIRHHSLGTRNLYALAPTGALLFNVGSWSSGTTSCARLPSTSKGTSHDAPTASPSGARRLRPGGSLPSLH